MLKVPTLRASWRPARNTLLYLSGLVAVLAALLWRLGSSPANPSPGELAALAGSKLSAIGDNMLFAPWKIVQDILVHISHKGMFVPRLSSVIFGLICLLAFYYCVRVWLGNIIAVLSTALLISTPLFLLASRQATPDILYFWPIVVSAAYLYFKRSGSTISVLLLAGALGLGLYVPGFLWMTLIACAFLWRTLYVTFKAMPKLNKAFLVLGLVILVGPLVAGLVLHPGLINNYLLIPDRFQSALTELKNWAWSLSAIFVRSQQHQSLILGHSSIFDIALAGLAVFGGYVLFSRLRGAFYMICAFLLFISLMSGLDGNFMALALVATPLLLAVSFGLRFLYLEWLHTFPTNPLPKYFAYGLMAAFVLIHVIYGLRYGLIAWPVA